jgi:predicted DNA-binding transcriptional regulator AlpA
LSVPASQLDKYPGKRLRRKRKAAGAEIIAYVKPPATGPPPTEAKLQRMICEDELHLYTTLRRTRRQELEEKGLFPRAIKVSDRRVAWLESELIAWQAERIKERETPRPKREMPQALRAAHNKRLAKKAKAVAEKAASLERQPKVRLKRRRADTS